MAKLPIGTFLTTRIDEYSVAVDQPFDLRKGTGFESLFFKPLEFILQPFRDEADNIQIAQSFRRILLTNDPDSFNEEAVDALANNLFVFRDTGAFSSGVARVYYNTAVAREWPSGGAVFTGSNGLQYANIAPFSITAAEMGAQIENGLFFYDLSVQATAVGASDLTVGGLISLAADPDVASVTNKLAIAGGRVKETNTQLITRTKSSIAVRDLVTGKGFNATLFENFPNEVTELQAVGMGDQEMMRDIIFNTHIGGKIDGYFKAPTVRQGQKAFVGLLVDVTRQSKTATNITLAGVTFTNVGHPNIDRSNGNIPILQEVKAATAASFTSGVDLTAPIDLSTRQYVRLGVDGVFRDVRVAGTTPASTSRTEILNLVNGAFGINILFIAGSSVRLTSTTTGLQSQVVITDPTIGLSAVNDIFGLSPGAHIFQGDGPITFVEGQDYNVDDVNGNVQRIIGPSEVAPQTTGKKTSASAAFQDVTAGVFTPVSVNDILTIETGPDAGDYRILSKVDNNNLVLDTLLTTTATSVHYHINRTGIKDGELVFIRYAFNPLSIDVGPLVKLDPLGKTRGLRPGRSAQTITDVAFLRINSIDLIDPVTQEPIGTTLNGLGGYGVGGYGEGPYGVGSGQDYYLVVNDPTARFSAFEDSYIVISSDFQGFSFLITYDYVPECLDLHNFARSENERVLDGDILMKHFLPAYVSGEITYSVDKTDAAIPDNATLQGLVDQFVNLRRSSTDLIFSEIGQFITRVTDPFDRFGTRVNDFSMSARIHNTDGTTAVVSGTNSLVVPTLDPFPVQTPRPLSPRIAHWIADAITLTRI